MWVACLMVAGGVLAGYTAVEFGELGMIVVWPLGWVGGLVARKILDGKSKLVGGQQLRVDSAEPAPTSRHR